MNRRRAFQTLLATTVGGVLVSGLVYARKVEPNRVEVRRCSLSLPRLGRPFEGYRIVQISDLHADRQMTPGRLLELVGLVNSEAPDLIVITGDFATHSPFFSLVDHAAKLAAPLRRLRSPDGTFAVLGNHDHKTDADLVRNLLSSGDVTELRNAVRTLKRNGASLHLCGIDSALEGKDRLERVLDGLPREEAAILLAHEPDFADTSAATGRFCLQLSGHSHGGQARLPLLTPFLLPPLSRKYPGGLYCVGGMLLYTNRGLGAHPNLRFNCRPEITVFTLQAE